MCWLPRRGQLCAVRDRLPSVPSCVPGQSVPGTALSVRAEPSPSSLGGLGTMVSVVGLGRASPSGTAAAVRGWDGAQHGTGTWARLPRWLPPKTSACQAHFFQAYLSYGAPGPGGWHGWRGWHGGTVARPTEPRLLLGCDGSGESRTWGWGGRTWGAPLALRAATATQAGTGELFSTRAGSVQPGAPRCCRRTRSAHFHLPLQVNKRRLARGGRRRSWPATSEAGAPAKRRLCWQSPPALRPPQPRRRVPEWDLALEAPRDGCPPGGRRWPG